MKVADRRRLTDLYARGEEVDLGENFLIWVRKMTPADAEIAYVKASNRRASVLSMARSSEPTEMFETLKLDVAALPIDTVIEFLAADEMGERTPIVESQVSFEDEWRKEGYLESLRERFNEEDFQKKYLEDPEDEEVKRISAEVQRFADQVEEELEKVRQDVEAELKEQSEEKLRQKTLEGMLEVQANAAWLAEFSRCQVWRCCFWADDHNDPVFPNRADVDKVQGDVFKKLSAVIDKIHVPDMEGKDSQQTPDSSQQSE